MDGNPGPAQRRRAGRSGVSRSNCQVVGVHGYQYPSPEDLWNRLSTRIYTGPAPAHRALEIGTAVQDYRCSQAVRLTPTVRALQASHARYVSKALAASVTRITHIFAHALKVARRLHAVG
jgi:hypothetical protein